MQTPEERIETVCDIVEWSNTHRNEEIVLILNYNGNIGYNGDNIENKLNNIKNKLRVSGAIARFCIAAKELYGISPGD